MPIHYGNPSWKVHALECGHCFHRRCILHWGKECPECRHGDKIYDLVSINCELHTTKYRRCFTIKMLRGDTIETLYAFIREFTKISARHLKMSSIDVKNNTFSAQNDPPGLNESIQSYCDRRENILNKLMGFSTLYSMTIHFLLDSKFARKIDTNPIKYKFSDPKDVYISVELEDSDIESNTDEVNDLPRMSNQSQCCIII